MSPSIKLALERLQYEAAHGHAEEPVHIVFPERDRAERIKNDKKQTRFVLDTKDPDAFSELNAEWQRIMIHLHRRKSIALTFVIRALREGLSNPELDRLMAEEEGDEYREQEAIWRHKEE